MPNARSSLTEETNSLGNILDIAININTSKLYALIGGENSIAIKDNDTFSKIPLDQTPIRVLVNPTINVIYVLGNSGITMIDGITNKIQKNVLISNGLNIAVNERTNMLYVLSATKTISPYGKEPLFVNLLMINTTGDIVRNKTISISGETVEDAIAINPESNLLYIYTYSNQVVSAVDGSDLEKISNITISPISTLSSAGAKDIAVNPNTNTIYIPNDRGDIV